MLFKKCYQYLRDRHALFSPSTADIWLDYNEDKILNYIKAKKAAEYGTKLHEIAEKHINNDLPFGNADMAIAYYVNDALRYGMDAEVVLRYSDNIFGTADSIVFDNKSRTLRIHDLKTGKRPVTKWNQLLVYAALFCFQEEIDPYTINYTELRFYQDCNNTEHHYISYSPSADEICSIMNKLEEKQKIFNLYESGDII